MIYCFQLLYLLGKFFYPVDDKDFVDQRMLYDEL